MNDFKITNTLDEQNSWFRECRRRQIYYVYIVERKKYSRIYWDHMSLELDGERESKIHDEKQEKQEIINIFMKHTKNINKLKFPLIAKYWVNNLVGYFDNIPNEIAPHLAKDLAEYLNSTVLGHVNRI